MINTKKIILTLLISAFFIPLLSINAVIDATNINPDPLVNKQKSTLSSVGLESGFNATPEDRFDDNFMATHTGQIYSFVLTFLGVVFIAYIIYSGIQWMTAGGNEEKITKARSRIIQATIGLAIISLAYAFAAIIVEYIN